MSEIRRRSDARSISARLVLQKLPAAHSVPEGVMKVDGIYGGVTANWILKFQLDFMLNGYPVQADNRVDRIRDKESFYDSSSDTVYTLAWLNWIVSSEEPEAFAKTAQFVPLQNPLSVPPSSYDSVIHALPQMIGAGDLTVPSRSQYVFGTKV